MSKIKLPALAVALLFSILTVGEEAVSSQIEAALEVGRDNNNLSADSQDRIDATESSTDKIVNEYKVVSKQVEGLKLYNAQKRIQIQAQRLSLIHISEPTRP